MIIKHNFMSSIITPVSLSERPVVKLSTSENINIPQPNNKLDIKTCPTCGVSASFFEFRNFENKICIPSIGPAKPERNLTRFGVELHFNYNNMTREEINSTGGNLARCQAVATENCAICFESCQEQAGYMWNQLTGWRFIHLGCWQNLCLRYHEEYLEPNNLVNTLGNWIKFLED